jgi:hypothetical protein
MDVPKPTWVHTLSDAQWLAAPVEERALFVARELSNDKVREVGRNAGTWVGRFLHAVGLRTGYSWCAAFVYYCLITAGADPAKLPEKRKAAGVINWRAWALAEQRMALLDLPLRGRAFFWLNGGLGHTGLCINVLRSNERTFRTIEGNTDVKGSREGDGVYDKTRTVDELLGHESFGFIDLGGLG